MEPGRSAGGDAAQGSMVMRLIIPVVSTLAGMALSTRLGAGIVPGALWGLTAGTAVVLLEYRASRVPTGYVLGGILGMVLGSLLAWLVGIPIDDWFPEGSRTVQGALQAVGLLAGFLVGARTGAGISAGSLRRTLTGSETEGSAKVLDTSSIIDGRIADVCDAGFLEGPLYVPQFILGELQHIADSSDSSKRTRGRRGLDVLRRLQKISGLDVRIVDDDYPKIRDVDAKLLAFAKVRLAKVITNDFNLNKVAEVQGVRVLNINELANAMKPPVLPGENLRVYVQKEGKEPNQGVAYLDDGTMVVVEQGRELMNRTVSVTVTSVLQTTAGRMIFARPGAD